MTTLQRHNQFPLTVEGDITADGLADGCNPHDRPAPGDTVLAIVVPCFNEGEVLHFTIPGLIALTHTLVHSEHCSEKSFILLVDDGSSDETWSTIASAATSNPGRVRGLRLASNVGHQAALLAGLGHVTTLCHAAVSMDADLQDDPSVVARMLAAYQAGSEIVLGVRSSRPTDTSFKRASAWAFYRAMKLMGVDMEANHADFRLMSNRALWNLGKFPERNLFLRCMPPLLHRRTAVVEYCRTRRLAGKTKYPLGKMLELAWNGITSFSAFPLHMISYVGGLIFVVSLMLAAFATFKALAGETLPGWASITVPLYLLGGMIMLSIGIVGEYVGKVFLETKKRPRFLIDAVIGEQGELRCAKEAARDHPQQQAILHNEPELGCAKKGIAGLAQKGEGSYAPAGAATE